MKHINTLKQCFVTYIHESSLQWLRSIPYHRENWIVISAFIERWQPKTNSFHMPFDEKTITLDDIPTLLGISVHDHSVNIPQRTTNAHELLINLLDVSSGEADDELGIARGT